MADSIITVGNIIVHGSNVKTKTRSDGKVEVTANKATIFTMDNNKPMNLILKGNGNMVNGSEKADIFEVHGNNNHIEPAKGDDTVKVYGEHNETKDHYNGTNYQSFTSDGKKQPNDPYKNTNTFRSPFKIK